MVGDLAWAKASYESVRGRIASSWKRDGQNFTLQVSIPANTSATVFVPAADPAAVRGACGAAAGACPASTNGTVTGAGSSDSGPLGSAAGNGASDSGSAAGTAGAVGFATLGEGAVVAVALDTLALLCAGFVATCGGE